MSACAHDACLSLASALHLSACMFQFISVPCICVHVTRCAPSQCEEDVPAHLGPVCVLSRYHMHVSVLVALSKSTFPAPGCGPTEQVWEDTEEMPGPGP